MRPAAVRDANRFLRKRKMGVGSSATACSYLAADLEAGRHRVLQVPQLEQPANKPPGGWLSGDTRCALSQQQQQK